MNNPYVDSILSSDVSFTDFPYIKGYFSYIIDSLIRVSGCDVDQLPTLVIKDTPYFESAFLETTDNTIIMFDVSASLFIHYISPALVNGNLTSKAWQELLKTSISYLTSVGVYQPGISYSLNLQWNMFNLNYCYSDIILELNDSLKFTKNFTSDFDIKCIDMFMLAHEVTHFFISKGYFDITLAHSLLENELKAFQKEVGILFNKGSLLADLNSDQLKKAHQSNSFLEEVICDSIALEIVLDYFFNGIHEEDLEKVLTSILSASQSLCIVTGLRLVISKEYDQHIDISNVYAQHLQMKLRADFLQSTIKRIQSEHLMFCTNQDEACKKTVHYSFVRSNIKNRANTILDCLTDNILETISTLQVAYSHYEPHFKMPELSSFYYLGYQNYLHETDEFIKSDKTIIAKVYKNGIDLKGKTISEGSVNINYISEDCQEKIQDTIEEYMCGPDFIFG